MPVDVISSLEFGFLWDCGLSLALHYRLVTIVALGDFSPALGARTNLCDSIFWSPLI